MRFSAFENRNFQTILQGIPLFLRNNTSFVTKQHVVRAILRDFFRIMSDGIYFSSHAILKTSDGILFPSDKFGEISKKFGESSEKIKKKSENVEKSLRIRPQFVRGMVLNSRRKH